MPLSFFHLKLEQATRSERLTFRRTPLSRSCSRRGVWLLPSFGPAALRPAPSPGRHHRWCCPPLSDNPARLWPRGCSARAADALWRVGEVVRMPGGPCGDHPIARGIMVRHNFLSPVVVDARQFDKKVSLLRTVMVHDRQCALLQTFTP